jgi:hypothetical protein
VSITLSLSSGPYNIPPTVDIPGLPARVTYLGQRVDISGISAQVPRVLPSVLVAYFHF